MERNRCQYLEFPGCVRCQAMGDISYALAASRLAILCSCGGLLAHRGLSGGRKGVTASPTWHFLDSVYGGGLNRTKPCDKNCIVEFFN